jgi:hypothetical protein
MLETPAPTPPPSVNSSSEVVVEDKKEEEVLTFTNIGELRTPDSVIPSVVARAIAISLALPPEEVRVTRVSSGRYLVDVVAATVFQNGLDLVVVSWLLKAHFENPDHVWSGVEFNSASFVPAFKDDVEEDPIEELEDPYLAHYSDLQQTAPEPTPAPDGWNVEWSFRTGTFLFCGLLLLGCGGGLARSVWLDRKAAREDRNDVREFMDKDELRLEAEKLYYAQYAQAAAAQLALAGPEGFQGHPGQTFPGQALPGLPALGQAPQQALPAPKEDATAASVLGMFGMEDALEPEQDPSTAASTLRDTKPKTIPAPPAVLPPSFPNRVTHRRPPGVRRRRARKHVLRAPLRRGTRRWSCRTRSMGCRSRRRAA